MKPQKSCHDFLLNSAKVLTATSLFGAGLVGYAHRSYALPATALRPPEALSEDAFNSACIRCGL